MFKGSAHALTLVEDLTSLYPPAAMMQPRTKSAALKKMMMPSTIGIPRRRCLLAYSCAGALEETIVVAVLLASLLCLMISWRYWDIEYRNR